MIYYISPYATDKRLGVAFNEHIKLLPDDSWICSTDGDAMFLTPDYGVVIEEAVKDNPDADLITCRTNRGYGQQMLTEPNILWHYKEANRIKEKSYTQIYNIAPAFMWLFPKRTWTSNHFDEYPIIYNFNSFDTRFMRGIKNPKIIRINNLYCFHYYRLHKDVKDITHLK